MKEITSFEGIILHDEGRGFSSLTGKSIVLDFYADWCEPCKISSPAVEQLSEEMVNVDFFKINVEKDQELVEMFAIKAIPTFKVITPDGKIATLAGWTTEEDLKKFVNDSVIKNEVS